MTVTREHPCNRCGGQNVVWRAPSPLWNLVMRGGTIDGDLQFADLVCMPCFIVLAEEAGLDGKWALTMRPEPEGLEKVAPSGRVWDERRWLWVAPEPAPGGRLDGRAVSEQVHAMADQLRQYATHFAPSDWDYTRQSDIKHIRRRGDWSGYDHPWLRVRRWLDDYFRLRPKTWVQEEGRKIAWRHPLVHARVSLRTQRHHPDGVLDGGNIITNWEEHGEYLQYVQPSVGSLLADWLDAEPESPHAHAIAIEMKRINDRYGQRVAAEEGDQ